MKNGLSTVNAFVSPVARRFISAHLVVIGLDGKDCLECWLLRDGSVDATQGLPLILRFSQTQYMYVRRYAWHRCQEPLPRHPPWRGGPCALFPRRAFLHVEPPTPQYGRIAESDGALV